MMGLHPVLSLVRFLINIRTNNFLTSSNASTEEARVARNRRSPPERASVWKMACRGGK